MKKQSYSILQVSLGECVSSFNLDKAVCNHGFFMMPPNRWDPHTKSLHRPLRLADPSTSVNVSISHPTTHQNSITIHIYDQTPLSFQDEQAIKKQVCRMLRISNKDERDLHQFQLLHEPAKLQGFGRIFRSPCLFEDVVKSILLCNCGWNSTLNMARRLCKFQARASNSTIGNFPTSSELAGLDEHLLNQHCKLGYRAKTILLFAKKVHTGKLNLEHFEDEANQDYDLIYQQFHNIKGFGTFVCANILMCLGFYHMVPADTETTRILQKLHSRQGRTPATLKKIIKEIYDKYAPFQCLAYWFELLEDYENKLGKLSNLDSCNYHKVTGTPSFRASPSTKASQGAKAKFTPSKTRSPCAFLTRDVKTRAKKRLFK